MSATYISQLETGNTNKNVSSVVRIAQALQIPPSLFFYLTMQRRDEKITNQKFSCRVSRQDTKTKFFFDKLNHIFSKGVFEMSLVGSIVGAIVKAAFNNLGAKKTAQLATSKPVREVGKQIIKHEIKKRFK